MTFDLYAMEKIEPCHCYAKTHKNKPGVHHANECPWYMPYRLEADAPTTALAALRYLEWSDSKGCAGRGFMGSGPPMHQHPACPACHQLEPDPDQNCFNKTAEGHKPFCWLNGLIALDRS